MVLSIPGSMVLTIPLELVVTYQSAGIQYHLPGMDIPALQYVHTRVAVGRDSILLLILALFVFVLK